METLNKIINTIALLIVTGSPLLILKYTITMVWNTDSVEENKKKIKNVIIVAVLAGSTTVIKQLVYNYFT